MLVERERKWLKTSRMSHEVPLNQRGVFMLGDPSWCEKAGELSFFRWAKKVIL
jgi:hypothetical protein